MIRYPQPQCIYFISETVYLATIGRCLVGKCRRCRVAVAGVRKIASSADVHRVSRGRIDRVIEVDAVYLQNLHGVGAQNGLELAAAIDVVCLSVEGKDRGGEQRRTCRRNQQPLHDPTCDPIHSFCFLREGRISFGLAARMRLWVRTVLLPGRVSSRRYVLVPEGSSS